MRKLSLILFTALVGLSVLRMQAQSFTLSMPDTTVAPNELIRVPIHAQGFEEIVSMQFSLSWDTSVVAYEVFQQGDLDDVAIGDLQAINGELRLSWFDIDGLGQSLSDGSVVIFLWFMAKGPEGSSSPLNFTDNPLPTQIHRAGEVPGEFEEVIFEPKHGLVTIATPVSVSVSENVTGISCFGASDGQIDIDVQASAAVNINWTGPDFSSSETSLSGLAPGEYSLLITDNEGIPVYEASILLSEPEQLVISDITTVDADCETGKGSASVVITGGTAPYTYDIGNGAGGAGLLENLSPDNYTLVLRDVNACAISDTFSIQPPKLPQVELGGQVRICPGETASLQAGNFSTYFWSTGDTTASIEVTEPATYQVTITDSDGCEAADEVLVLAAEMPQLFIENDFLDLCQGESIELLVSGAESYSWIDSSGSLSALNVPNPVARPDTTAGYAVIGSNACGADTVELEVLVYEVDAMAGPDTCVGPGDVAQLTAFGGVNYHWEPARYPVSDPNIANPIARPEDSTTYVVAITDFQGCVIRDSVTVLVANNPEAVIRAVNLITPNGDERNDVLYFPNIEKFGQNSLKVFNRWGNTVYQKMNYQGDEERFDGTYKGKPLPQGTYYYMLSFRTGEIKQKLTILR